MVQGLTLDATTEGGTLLKYPNLLDTLQTLPPLMLFRRIGTKGEVHITRCAITGLSKDLVFHRFDDTAITGLKKVCCDATRQLPPLLTLNLSAHGT